MVRFGEMRLMAVLKIMSRNAMERVPYASNAQPTAVRWTASILTGSIQRVPSYLSSISLVFKLGSMNWSLLEGPKELDRAKERPEDLRRAARLSVSLFDAFNPRFELTCSIVALNFQPIPEIPLAYFTVSNPFSAWWELEVPPSHMSEML